MKKSPPLLTAFIMLSFLVRVDSPLGLHFFTAFSMCLLFFLHFYAYFMSDISVHFSASTAVIFSLSVIVSIFFFNGVFSPSLDHAISFLSLSFFYFVCSLIYKFLNPVAIVFYFTYSFLASFFCVFVFYFLYCVRGFDFTFVLLVSVTPILFYFFSWLFLLVFKKHFRSNFKC